MKYILCIFIISLLNSCSHSNIQPALHIVDNMLEEQPENALAVLETVKNPERLSSEDLFKYKLTYIKVKDKCYKNLAEDTTEIINILKYYKEHNNNMATGWAYYYAGRVFHDAGNEKSASIFYLEASTYAKNNSDTELGIMSNYYLGEFHANQFNFAKAITSYKQALNFCLQSKKQKFKSLLLSSVGYSFGQNNQMDSALLYLKEAYTIAIEQKDSIQIVNTANDLSIFLSENNQFSEAKKYLQETLHLCNKNDLFTQSINLAYIHINNNQTDSAFFILEQLEKNISESNNIEKIAIFHETLSKIEEERGMYQKALYHHILYAAYQDSIYIEKKKNSLAEIEAKYNYKIVNDYNSQLISEKRNIMLTFISALLLLIIVIFKFQQKMRQKKSDLYEAEEKLNVLQCLLKKNENNQIDSKDKKNMSEEDKEHVLKNFLLRQLDISTKIALMNAQNPEKHKTFLMKFNEVMYGEQRSFQLNWEELYPFFNMLYGDFVHVLQIKYTILAEKDIQLCCLLFINLTTAEISFLMEQSIHTVHKRKTEIRKKLKMPEGSDIASFLKENILIQP